MGRMNTIVVTGVSRGLGRITAEKFVEEGWNVIGTGRSSRPDDLPESIAYYRFDASSAEACAHFWEEISEKHRNVCLVNNAGGYVDGSVVETSSDDFQKQMAANYFASVFMTQGLLTRVSRARVVNVISAGALGVHAGQSAYGASKAAAMHFFQALRAEVDPKKYKIINIYPSDIATHGVNEKAIQPVDLAVFIVEQMQRKDSLYLADVTMYPAQSE